MLTEINWPAVIIGTIIYCAFCGIWHRQFAFGKKWEKAMGFQRPENWKETNIEFAPKTQVNELKSEKVKKLSFHYFAYR